MSDILELVFKKHWGSDQYFHYDEINKQYVPLCGTMLRKIFGELGDKIVITLIPCSVKTTCKKYRIQISPYARILLNKKRHLVYPETYQYFYFLCRAYKCDTWWLDIR